MTPKQHEDNLMTCVHCGFCLPACPTYLETGSEADSPRGRIVMMRGLHEGTLHATDPDVVRHLDLCLGCRACETACPSGVPYGHLLETTRGRICAEHAHPLPTEAARTVLLGTLTQPKRMTVAMRFAQIAAAGRVPAPAVRRCPATAGPGRRRRCCRIRFASAAARRDTCRGPKRARVGVLIGCVMRVLYGDVNADTVPVLAANGCEVLANRRQGCCGALHAHRGRGKKPNHGPRPDRCLFAAGWPGCDCGQLGRVRQCHERLRALLADDPAYAARAQSLPLKCAISASFWTRLAGSHRCEPSPRCRLWRTMMRVT